MLHDDQPGLVGRQTTVHNFGNGRSSLRGPGTSAPSTAFDFETVDVCIDGISAQDNSN